MTPLRRLLMLMAKAAAAAITFIDSASTQNANSNDVVITKPTGTVDAHLMIALVSCAAASRSWTQSVAWNERLESLNTSSMLLATRVAASEGASYTFTMSGGKQFGGGSILTYANAQYDTVGASSAASGTPAAPSVTVAAGGGRLLAFFAAPAASCTFSTPTGMTPLVSNSDASVPSWAVFYEDVAAGATGTRTSTCTGSASAQGVLLSITPSP
jgi:hypothetical protein